MRRVVVTGLGAVTPLGNDWRSTWEAAVAGRSGIDFINSFDASGLWAGILFLVAITWMLTQLVNVVQSRVLRWQAPKRGRTVSIA